MKRKVVLTADGSHTLEIKDGAEHYHSMHGAVQEAQHVFIEAGLAYKFGQQSKVSVLEIGMGTGLNAFLTFCWMEKHEGVLEYTGMEAFPLQKDEWEVLNYADLLGPGGPEEKEELQGLWNTLHDSPWEAWNRINESVKCRKLQLKVQDFSSKETFDVVYFDAFGPRHQPDMWTDEVFELMATLISPGGVLVTYCAKGEVRRSMQRAGLKVERLPGPPGKREMLRAIKTQV